MNEIVLNEQQAKAARDSQGPVAVRDSEGNLLGYLSDCKFTPEEIEEAKRALASDRQRYTTKQVLEHLRSLEQK